MLNYYYNEIILGIIPLTQRFLPAVFAENPESSVVEFGEDVTLSCSSNEISVTLEAITWYNVDGTMMKNDTAMTTSGE